MAIEFRCTQCGKLLRTGDDTAGKPAQCPECGALTTIPPAGAAPGNARPVDSGNPYQSPSPFAPLDPNQPPGAMRPTILDLGDVFSRTWSIFKEQWGMCVAASLIVVVLNVVIANALTFGGMQVGRVVLGPRDAVLLSHLGSVVGMLINVWLGIGMALYFLKVARGQAAVFGDLFSGGPYYVNVLLATLLFMVIFYIGLILCIVPGVILGLMFSQFYYLVLDRRMPVLDAFRQSKELMNGNKLTLFLIWLAMMGIFLVAMIPCGLGLLVAGPYFSLMFAVIYLTITGQPTAEQVSIRPTM